MSIIVLLSPIRFFPFFSLSSSLSHVALEKLGWSYREAQNAFSYNLSLWNFLKNISGVKQIEMNDVIDRKKSLYHS